MTILRQSLQTKTQFLFSWIRTLKRVSCWREHWWHDFITQTWTQVDHRIRHFVGRRFDELLVSLFEPIHFLWVHFLGHECVSTFPVQTRIGIRWVDLPSLHDNLYHTFKKIIMNKYDILILYKQNLWKRYLLQIDVFFHFY